MANKIIKPRPRPGSANKITKESLIGSMTESDILKAIEEGNGSEDIGSSPSGGTRGMNPLDNYSKEDLMKLLGSLSGVAMPGMGRSAAKIARRMQPQKMEAGGAALVGGQKKLDKNKDGKISGADFRMMEEGGEAKVKKRKKSKKSKGNMCRGGGAALRGTSFSGVK